MKRLIVTLLCALAYATLPAQTLVIYDARDLFPKDAWSPACKAFVPLSEQFGYVTVLRTLSSGRATSTMTFDHYAEVPANLAKDIVEKSGYRPVEDE